MRKLLIALILFSFSQAMSAQCPPSSTPGIHIVQKGQTYYRLSKMYNVSVDQILAWNGRTVNDVLSICTPIRVAPATVNTTPASAPNSTTTTTTSPSQSNNTTPINYAGSDVPPGRYSKPYNQYQKQIKGVHYAKADENLVGIAALYGYTPDRFREFNGLNSNEEVVTGQILRTTDCACLNTVTDSESEYVETGSISTGSGTTVLGGTANVDGTVNSGSTSTGNTGTVTTSTGGGTITTGNVSTASTSVGATSGNPIAKASYMSKDELLMIDEINLIRSNPSGYIPYVQEYISHLQRNGSFGNSIQTARDLIVELQKTPALSTLKPSECVYNAARKHGADEKRLGRSDHMGSDGSWPWDRVLRECPSLQDGNENLVGGPADIRRAVMLLLVDDGIPNRGHRKTLLNPSWKYVACYKVGMIGSMPNSWVQNFAY